MMQKIGKLLPKRMRNGYRSLIRYNEMRIDPDKLAGTVVFFGIFVAIFTSLLTTILLQLTFTYMPFLALFFYVLFQAAVYMWLSISADSKGKYVDSILPDALQLMAVNLRAGITTDRALLISARKEFGQLEKELNKAGKQVLAGKDIKTALLDVPKGIRSKQLEKTIKLIVEGVENGGELASLLEQTAADIQNTRLIEGEIRANVLMYAIFIFFAAGIGAPMLFGISTFLVSSLGSQFQDIKVPESVAEQTALKIGQGSINVSADFLLTFAILALVVNSFFGGMIIGIIKGGNEKDGFKTIPLLFAVAMIVFFVVRLMVGGIFAGLG